MSEQDRIKIPEPEEIHPFIEDFAIPAARGAGFATFWGGMWLLIESDNSVEKMVAGTVVFSIGLTLIGISDSLKEKVLKAKIFKSLREANSIENSDSRR